MIYISSYIYCNHNSVSIYQDKSNQLLQLNPFTIQGKSTGSNVTNS